MKLRYADAPRTPAAIRVRWTAVLLLALAACASGDAAPAQPAPTRDAFDDTPAAPAAPAAQQPRAEAALVADPAQAAKAAPQHFGAPFSAPPAPMVALAQLLASPDRAPDHPILVEGIVRQACTRRGCWFELATSMATDAPGCRVILKDHAFFVPLDSAGAHARVEGTATVKTVAAAQVSHMEEEGGRFDHKNPDGSALELRLVASGVSLRR